MTTLLQCLRDELVRRDYAAPTIRSYVQIVEPRRLRVDLAAALFSWSAALRGSSTFVVTAR